MHTSNDGKSTALAPDAAPGSPHRSNIIPFPMSPEFPGHNQSPSFAVGSVIPASGLVPMASEFHLSPEEFQRLQSEAPNLELSDPNASQLQLVPAPLTGIPHELDNIRSTMATMDDALTSLRQRLDSVINPEQMPLFDFEGRMKEASEGANCLLGLFLTQLNVNLLNVAAKITALSAGCQL